MNNGWQFPNGLWRMPSVSKTKEIEFVCGDPNVLKHFPIIPAKDCLPDWYKKLNAQDQNGVPTIAGCMPVRDIVTSGYIIPNAFEQEIITSSVNEKGEEELDRVFPVEEMGKFLSLIHI